MVESTMTMSDIARLCGVSRPLVTMWRARTTKDGAGVPFPEPVASSGRSPRFATSDVQEYLRRTGRGKNPEAALEAPSVAQLDELAPDALLVLLCLRELAQDDLADRDLIELAARLDPDDHFVRAEISAIGPELASHVDELGSISFGSANALERFEATRSARAHDYRELTEDGVTLVAAVVAALVVHLGADGTDLVDGSGARAGSPLQVARLLKRPIWIDGDEASARSARRRALLAGVHLDRRDAGPAVRLDSVCGLTEHEAVERADLLELELAPGDVGVLVGPAPLLVDPLTDEHCLGRRNGQLGNGHLRAVVRLPRSLYRDAARQDLALWILAGDEVPDRPPLVADLSHDQVRDLDPDDLATDVVAALAGDGRHHFRYLVPRPATQLASSRVVPKGLRGRAPRRPVNASGRFQELARAVDAALPALTVREDSSPLNHVEATIAELRRRGDLRVHSGTRIDLGWSVPDGTVLAIGRDDWGEARFDPVDLERRAPTARRTEPGDVVVTVSPPRAVVDEDGGRVVPTPGRILRLRPGATVGPYTLAAQINRLPASARDLDAWRVRVGIGPDTEQRLAAAARIRSDLLARAAALDELSGLVLDGDAGLTFDFDPPTDRTA